MAELALCKDANISPQRGVAGTQTQHPRIIEHVEQTLKYFVLVYGYTRVSEFNELERSRI